VETHVEDKVEEEKDTHVEDGTEEEKDERMVEVEK